jgi:hypothetical protein
MGVCGAADRFEKPYVDWARILRLEEGEGDAEIDVGMGL